MISLVPKLLSHPLYLAPTPPVSPSWRLQVGKDPDPDIVGSFWDVTCASVPHVVKNHRFFAVKDGSYASETRTIHYHEATHYELSMSCMLTRVVRGVCCRYESVDKYLDALLAGQIDAPFVPKKRKHKTAREQMEPRWMRNPHDSVKRSPRDPLPREVKVCVHVASNTMHVAAHTRSLQQQPQGARLISSTLPRYAGLSPKCVKPKIAWNATSHELRCGVPVYGGAV